MLALNFVMVKIDDDVGIDYFLTFDNPRGHLRALYSRASPAQPWHRHSSCDCAEIRVTAPRFELTFQRPKISRLPCTQY